MKSGLNNRDIYDGKLADAESRLVIFHCLEKSEIWNPLEVLIPKFVNQKRIEALIKELAS